MAPRDYTCHKKYALRVFFSDSYFLVTCHILRIFSKLNTFYSAFLSHMQKRQIIVYFTCIVK